jgi:putative transposase
MVRKSRFTIPGVPQYVIQRGNNPEPCFFFETDYRCYLDVLHESASRK